MSKDFGKYNDYGDIDGFDMEEPDEHSEEYYAYRERILEEVFADEDLAFADGEEGAKKIKKAIEMKETEEWAKDFGRVLLQFMESKRDEDYIPSKVQMSRFLSVVEYFLYLAKKYGGEVEPVELSPKEESGAVEIKLPSLTLNNEESKRFSKILSCVSAMDIDPTTDDMVCMTAKVNYVFVPKNDNVRWEEAKRLKEIEEAEEDYGQE